MSAPIRLDELPAAGRAIVLALLAAAESTNKKAVPVTETSGTAIRAEGTSHAPTPATAA